MTTTTPTADADHGQRTGSTAPEIATMPTERLEAEICTWAASIAAAECRFIEMIAELDRRKGWSAWGMASCAQWLSWKCGLAPEAARERVRVARALADLPYVLEEFRKGKLSYSKVRAITRVAEPHTELDLLHLATQATAGQLEVIVRAWRKGLEARNLDHQRRQHEGRSLTYRFDDDGSLVGRFKIPADEAETFLAGLNHFTAPPPSKADRERHVSAETPTLEQRRADGLLAMADTALGGGTAREPNERAMAVIEVDHDTLANDQPGKCQTSRGHALAAETARRITCEVLEMYVVVDRDGEEIGRTTPTKSIPRSIRRALRRRDQDRCRFPACDRTGQIEAHHLVHRAHGGTNELENLATLCRFHHHLVHEGGFSIALDNDAKSFVATTRDGRRVTERPEADPVRFDPQRALRADGIEPGPDTLHRGFGERMNRDDVFWSIGATIEFRERQRFLARDSAEARRPGPYAKGERPPVWTAALGPDSGIGSGGESSTAYSTVTIASPAAHAASRSAPPGNRSASSRLTIP